MSDVGKLHGKTTYFSLQWKQWPVVCIQGDYLILIFSKSIHIFKNIFSQCLKS